MTPVVSVIMPVYNCAGYVHEAISSILNQTFTDFELIIIDDASTDSTAEVVASVNDQRIRLLRKAENSGYTNSLNLGLEQAKGAFIARMDGDDISMPDRFQKQVTFLTENPDMALCGTWFKLIPQGEIIKHPQHFDNIKLAFLDYSAIGHPTVMFNASILRRSGLKYDVNLEPAEDYDLWTRMIGHGKMANLPEVLLEYRVHQSQVSTTRQLTQQRRAEVSKRRMYTYLLTEVTSEDDKVMNMIFEPSQISNTEMLSKIFSWLDGLVLRNKQKEFFLQEEFQRYILSKKEGLIRAFFFYRRKYNPAVLNGFTRFNRKWNVSFSLSERLKFALKCLLFWNYRKTA